MICRESRISPSISVFVNTAWPMSVILVRCQRYTKTLPPPLRRLHHWLWSHTIKLSGSHNLRRHNRTMSSSYDSITPCRVAVVQMTSVPNKEDTFSQASDMVKKAKAQGAGIVFLPEACDYIGDSRSSTTSAAEALDGDIMTRYRHLASQLGVWLSLGSVHVRSGEDSDNRLSNTHVMVDDKGEIKATYSKTHLFDVDIPGKIRLQETDFTKPGTTIGPPVATPAGHVGMAICYDMRFPELSTILTQQGAEILTYPSAFTVPTGRAHWEVLLRARAIENQCFVIAAAQVGQHHTKRASYGHSMVIDPWGEVLLDLKEDVGFGVIDLDMTSLHSRRLQMPVWNHRRHDLYGYLTVNTRPSIDSVSQYQFGQVTVAASCVFYRTALTFAFVNKKPVVPGHVLISPLRPAERLEDLTPAEVADLAHTTQTIAKVIPGHYGCNSHTLGVQDGAEAGQSIKHVHFHVLPRKKGDFNRNDDIYTELETHDKAVTDSDWRTETEMALEAAQLRKLFS